MWVTQEKTIAFFKDSKPPLLRLFILQKTCFGWYSTNSHVEKVDAASYSHVLKEGYITDYLHLYLHIAEDKAVVAVYYTKIKGKTYI